MDKAKRLAAALRKDDDTARAPPPSETEPASSSGVLKLRKSSLLGGVTWERCMELLELNGRHDYEACVATITKLLGNVLASPDEPKFRKIRTSNATFAAKVYSCKGAPELLALAGFDDAPESGHLVLPAGADLAPLQHALDLLKAQAAGRTEAEEKKRKLLAEKEASARSARAQKQREAAAPAEYDAAVAAASQAAGEEEEMIAAIEAYVGRNPVAVAGRELDAFEVERQVAGPGGSVVLYVVGSAGTQYFEYTVLMVKGDGGWTVKSMEAVD
mmetsp:Transcript_18203/g.52713  ORF Transcript_18203/g.52713 Transcript_18203/m.52713 type:complete len:273 (+) Transcript_18203:36-854(+)